MAQSNSKNIKSIQSFLKAITSSGNLAPENDAIASLLSSFAESQGWNINALGEESPATPEMAIAGLKNRISFLKEILRLSDTASKLEERLGLKTKVSPLQEKINKTNIAIGYGVSYGRDVHTTLDYSSGTAYLARKKKRGKGFIVEKQKIDSLTDGELNLYPVATQEQAALMRKMDAAKNVQYAKRVPGYTSTEARMEEPGLKTGNDFDYLRDIESEGENRKRAYSRRRRGQQRDFIYDTMDEYSRFIHEGKRRYGSKEKASEAYLHKNAKWLEAIAKSNPRIAKHIPQIAKGFSTIKAGASDPRVMLAVAAATLAGRTMREQYRAISKVVSWQAAEMAFGRTGEGIIHAGSSLGYDKAQSIQISGALKSSATGLGYGIGWDKIAKSAMFGTNISKFRPGMSGDEYARAIVESVSGLDEGRRILALQALGELDNYAMYKLRYTPYSKWSKQQQLQAGRKEVENEVAEQKANSLIASFLWSIDEWFGGTIQGVWARHKASKKAAESEYEENEKRIQEGRFDQIKIRGQKIKFVQDLIKSKVEDADRAARSADVFESESNTTSSINNNNNKSIMISIGKIESSADDYNGLINDIASRASVGSNALEIMKALDYGQVA